VSSNPHDLTQGILFTDQYQLTMAQLYFRQGMHERSALFDHFYRDYPNYGVHQSGYCINAGLDWLLDWMARARFGEPEIEYLRGQMGAAGDRLFDDDFLAWLRENGTFDGITLMAIPEGRVVHANVPLTVVEGPLAMAQILETALLNYLNYQTLIATKASRIHEAGRGRMMLEFGLRRGPERGANAGTRAALIGGADFSSNVGVSQALGLPPKGTHAHSMVQVFIALGATELDAFRAYAEVFPDDCVLLVDTLDTLDSGIPNAIRVFEELRRKGHTPVGVRLDSGDLAYLSIRAARMLDQAGFPDVSIVLSNQIDELTLWQIITQIEEEAPEYGVEPDKLIGRLVYGVGTRLISSAGDSALDGVYKLVAVCDEGRWLPAIKISETPEKTPNPGHKRVWRLYDQRGKAIADLLGVEDEDPNRLDPLSTHHPTQFGAERSFRREEISQIEPLLVEVFRQGHRLLETPSLDDMRAKRQFDLDRLYPGVRRLMKPHVYHVSLTKKLWDYKQELIASVKKNHSS
jgi:nicotinate phosphoribosyltransferase